MSWRLAAVDGARLVLEGGLQAVRARVREELWGARSVLDVGCGTGLLRAAAGDVAWTGVDVDRHALGAARRRARAGDRLVEASATALPFPDGAFDRVLCHGVLHHLDDAQAAGAVAELARVCGGRLLVMDLVRDGAPVWRRGLYRLDAGRWIRDRAALERLVDRACGLRKVSVFRSGVNLKALLLARPR